MFKNTKIGTRLSLGFGSILILICFLGIFAICRMEAVDNNLQSLVHDKWFKVVILDDIRKQNDLVLFAFLKGCFATDPAIRSRELNRVSSAEKVVNRQLELLKERVGSDAGKKLLYRIAESRSLYLVQQRNAMELLRRGKREEAVTLTLGNLAQAQAAYVEAVNALAKHQDDLVEQLVLLADETYHLSLRLIPGMLAGVTLLVVLIAWLITRSITRPLAICVDAANRIACGDTTVLLDDTAKDETGILQGAMVRMVVSLKALVGAAEHLTQAAVAGRLACRADVSLHQGDFRQIMAGFNGTLDAVIGPLNVAAEYVDRISKGDIPPRITDIYSGDFNEIKLNLNNCIDIMNNLLGETNRVLEAAADGRLDERADGDLFIGDWKLLVLGVNNIVSEIVNPLRRTTELLNHEVVARCTSQELLITKQLQLEELNAELAELVAVEVEKNRQRYQALMQNEKMASLGQLAAGVVHEINNPLGYVASNLRIMSDYFAQLVMYDRVREGAASPSTPSSRESVTNNRVLYDIDNVLEDGADLIKESLEGVERVTKIVLDLKGFSRKDAPVHEPVELNSCLESALNICNNELKYVATVRRELGLIPEVLGNSGQLHQVFLNLLVNAGQAIVPMGEIVLRSWHDDDFVHVSVSDDGEGIPEETLTRIFEPFFTTKEEGKGTGLGLSISYEIIKQHNGEFLVESVIGAGTTFTVVLPRTPRG